jgi:hypothetical protein
MLRCRDGWEKHWRLVGALVLLSSLLSRVLCMRVNRSLTPQRAMYRHSVHVELRHSLSITHPCRIHLHLLKESCLPTATRTNDDHPG